MSRAIFILSIAIFVFPVTIAQALSRSQFYSQNVFNQRSQIFTTENRVWLFPFSEFTPLRDMTLSHYLGMRLEQDFSNTRPQVSTRSQPSLGLLAQYHPFGMGAYVEIGASENRAALYQYSFVRGDRHFAATFFESYTDMATKSQWMGNLILAHQSKIGLRLHEQNGLAFDFYPELVFHQDASGWAYENFTDLRYGARLGFRKPKWSLGFSISVASGLYAGDRRFFTPLKSMLVFAVDQVQ